LKKNIELGELRSKHNNMWLFQRTINYLLCSKVFLQLLFEIGEGVEKEEDFT